MLNTPETYREAGRKCGEARRQHDEARAQFHKSWFSRAKALEQGEDKIRVQSLFDKGYEEGRAFYANT